MSTMDTPTHAAAHPLLSPSSSLQRNPESSHVLTHHSISHSQGIGYSYIDKGAATLPYVANDTTTSADSLGALQDFFATYSQFRTSPLYVVPSAFSKYIDNRFGV
jgi:hypothetical protein